MVALGAAELDSVRRSLEQRRRARLEALGVSEACIAASELGMPAEGGNSRDKAVLRVMQFNALAQGMSDDGFCVRPVLREWPLNHNCVPTTSGLVVEFGQMLSDMMTARGKEDVMAELKAKYDLGVSRNNLAAIVDAEARELQQQLLVLASGRPDIIIMQEVDYFGSLSRGLAELGYASQLPGRSEPYRPAHCDGCGGTHSDGPEAQAAFIRQWEEAGHSFLPKLDSTAMSMTLRAMSLTDRLVEAAKEAGVEEHITPKDKGKTRRCSLASLPGGSAPLLKACGVDPVSIDDDGVAVFWRRDRLEATSLKAHLAASEGCSVIEVHLRDLSSGRDVVVLGTHLSSGDAPADEERRLTKQVLPADGLAACARRVRDDVGGSAVGAARGLILSLDANAHPQLRPPGDVPNVWVELRRAVGACVWDDHFDEHGAERAGQAPTTSNKLRGFGSDQVRKIGNHHPCLIDHVFFDPKAFGLAGHVFGPRRYENHRQALEDLQPTLANPSDHFPVVVDLRWL